MRSARYLEAHAEQQEFLQRWRSALAEQLQRDESLEVESMRSLSPLSTLSTGLESITPYRFYSTKEGLRFGESRGAHDPVDALFGHLDLATIVQLVVSLLTIALSFDSVCGERKQGTLSVLLSYPVSRATVLLAKVASTVIMVGAICALSFCAAAISQVLIGAPLRQPAIWFSFVAIVVLFIATFAAVSVGISTISREPANAVVLALSFWAAAVVLIPRAAAVVINAAVPPGSAIERNLRLDAAISALRVTHARELHVAYDRYLSAGASVNHDKELRQEVADATERLSVERRRIIDRMLQQSLREEEERSRYVRIFASFSPAAIFAESAAELAGTGRLQRQLFQTQARLYDDEIGRRLVESRQVMQSERPTATSGAGSALVLVDNVRPFMIAFQTSWVDGGDIAAAVIPNALALVVMTSVVMMLAYQAFLRLDVRP